MTKETDPIQTEATNDWKFQIPKGLTTMNVERIKGVGQSDGMFEVVNTWLASRTSDTSPFQKYDHGCCKNNVMVLESSTGA